MCITLVKDNTACFTWEDLEYFKKHRNAFTFYREYIEELTNILTNGEDVPRANYQDGGRFFHIKNDGIVVGELWIDWCDATEDEISIRIFDEYQKKGYATQAILYYLEHQRREGAKVIAVCKCINPLREHIERMLERCGFEYTEEDGGCYQYIES